EVDTVLDLLDRRRDHALELHLTGGKGHALARLAQPAEEETGQLPHGVEAKAARHDRIAREVAREEPMVRLDLQLGANEALVELATGLADLGDAIEHEHRRGWKLGVPWPEQLSARAGQQIFIFIARLLFEHR